MKSKLLQNNITTLYGEAGKKWLKDLPSFLKCYEAKFNIKIHEPFKNLTYHYVATATLANKEETVFKCSVPNSELTTEIAALKHFDGNGVVRLIDANEKEGWLLLEKLIPGDMLSSINDENKAACVASMLMKKIWKPIHDKHSIFPTVEKWLLIFDRIQENIIPKNLTDDAKSLAKELLSSRGELVLLHGDFHHDNILSATREPWLAIDPKGVIGEREFDIGAFMKNPASLLNSEKNIKELFSRRMDIITEITQLDRWKITAWSFIVMLLSVCWEIEDHGRCNNHLIYCAKNLREFL